MSQHQAAYKPRILALITKTQEPIASGDIDVICHIYVLPWSLGISSKSQSAMTLCERWGHTWSTLADRFYTYLLGTYYVQGGDVREQNYHFLTMERLGDVQGASNILFLITIPKTNNSVLMSLMRKLREVRSLAQHASDKRYWDWIWRLSHSRNPCLSTLASLSKQNTPFLLQNCWRWSSFF